MGTRRQVENYGATLNTNYSSAAVDMLNRDDGSVKGLMLYPITKIQLMEIRDGKVVPARTFIVNELDQWVEVS